MDIFGAIVVVTVVLGFGYVAARYGVIYVARSRSRGRPARSLPWWYIGGQPEIPVPPPDAHTGAKERVR